MQLTINTSKESSFLNTAQTTFSKNAFASFLQLAFNQESIIILENSEYLDKKKVMSTVEHAKFMSAQSLFQT